jgi:hypothetical protein
MGISIAALNRLRFETLRNPNLEVIFNIAAMFDTTIDELIDKVPPDETDRR